MRNDISMDFPLEIKRHNPLPEFNSRNHMGKWCLNDVLGAAAKYHAVRRPEHGLLTAARQTSVTNTRLATNKKREIISGRL